MKREITKYRFNLKAENAPNYFYLVLSYFV